MRQSLQILLLAGSLISGILVILMTAKLVKKYNQAYISSYFFYLIFMFVFGVYSLIGSRLIHIFLDNQGVRTEILESTFLFFIYIGFPFLILSWYMFIRLSGEWANKQLSPVFNIVFFVIMVLIIAGFGLILARRELLGENRYEILKNALLIAFSALSILVYGYAIVQLFINSFRKLDIKEKLSMRLFGYFYLFYSAAIIILINLSARGNIYAFGLIIMLFAFHLLPVFFLTLHLDRNFVIAVKNPDFDSSLERFIHQYNISKRETEIVQLICQGKTNQEIGDSLFISIQTVKDHVYSIYLKTGVKNRVQLTNLIRTFS